MKTGLLVLGDQLFPLENLKNLDFDSIIMIEDLSLCTHFKYHKHKIVFFLSAMRHYRDQLIEQGYTVDYLSAESSDFEIDYELKLEMFLVKGQIEKIKCFEIQDSFFRVRIKDFVKKNGIDIEEIRSPMFLCPPEEFKEYLSDYRKPFMKTFYEGERKRLGILLDKDGKPEGGSWSYDSENRHKLKKGVELPDFTPAIPDEVTSEVMLFVESAFKDHPGSVENFWIPVTTADAKKWLEVFLHERLHLFGDYQDAITDRAPFLFHSLISPLLNSGLLTPDFVCDEILKKYNKNKNTVHLNSVEGIIRQIIGWREFVRGIYQNFEDVESTINFWNHKRKLTRDWYTGDTQIPVLDYAIKKAEKWGYNHHIERLMVVSNMMLLCEIDPKEVHRWFMEMFVDSADWVMGPNVYGMGQFSDGGIFATKPYICGSNYYLKMSDFKKGDWCEVVDGLYWRFIDKNVDFYKSNPRMGMMVKLLEKMDPKRKEKIISKANDFIKKMTKI